MPAPINWRDYAAPHLKELIDTPYCWRRQF